MADEAILYISAAGDLMVERDLVSRAVTEIPVSIGWRIVQSPSKEAPVDLEAVSRADFHLLLLGSDIRAPIGLEWLVARRAGRNPVLFLKHGIMRTPAGQEFIRNLEEYASWKPFKDNADLRRQILTYLTDQILERALHFTLRPAELERLQAWRGELESAASIQLEGTQGGAGESGVILSTERYIPSEGVLIQSKLKESEQ